MKSFSFEFTPSRLLLAAALASFLACSGPSAGSKTHWFQNCDVDADCNEETACLCGICSLECSSDSECQQGTCGSLIVSAGTCGNGERRICLPDHATTCSEPLTRTADLGPPAVPDCSTPGALLCESFDEPLPESYRINSSTEDLLSLQSCISSDGPSALSSRAPPGGAAEVQMLLAEEVQAGPLYMRLRVYLPSGGEPGHNAALFALRPGDAYTDEGKVVRLRNDGGIAIQLVVSEGSVPSAPDALPRDEWACVELELDVATAGTARISVGSTEVLSTAGETLPPSGPLTTVVVFGGVGDAAAPLDVAVDDLIVATSPIGCD